MPGGGAEPHRPAPLRQALGRLSRFLLSTCSMFWLQAALNAGSEANSL